MEKRKPHYRLELVQAQFLQPGGYKVTRTAQDFAFRQLKLERAGVIDLVQGIRQSDFYKSMTAHRNHRIWQDVYHVPFEGDTLYVKFTETDDGFYMLISLKDKQP